MCMYYQNVEEKQNREKKASKYKSGIQYLKHKNKEN